MNPPSEWALQKGFDLVENMLSNTSDMLTASDARFACALTDDANAIARALDEAREEARREEREACAKVCEEQEAIFLSDGYAIGQPTSSFSERFACREIAAAILARGKSNE